MNFHERHIVWKVQQLYFVKSLRQLLEEEAEQAPRALGEPNTTLHSINI